MATLLERVEPLQTININVPILKVEKGGDGTLLVHGKVTDDGIDLDDQIIDKDWAREALQKWFEGYGNVRQMHSTQLQPGGKGVKLEEGTDGFYLTTKVVEPVAVRLVEEGIYKAYSIGVSKPVIVRDPVAHKGRVKGGIISEVSLVDFPANPRCVVKLVDETGDVQKVFKGGTEVLELPDAPMTLFDDMSDLADWDLSDAPFDLDPEFAFDPELAAFMEAPADFDPNFDDSAVDEKSLPEAELTKFVSAQARRRDAKSGVAMKDGSFPIPDEGHLRSAIGHLGNYKGNKSAAKAHIIRRARALGLTHLLPKDWHIGGGKKIEEPVAIKETNPLLVEAAKLQAEGRHEEALAKLQEAVDGALRVEHLDLTGQQPQTALVAEPSQPAPAATAAPERVLVLAKMGVGTQFRVRQLHDVVCPAYSWETVTAAYPHLDKNGVAAHLGPKALALIHEMLLHEVEENAANKGADTQDVLNLRCAYEDLVAFLNSEAAEHTSESVLVSARADLHKAFAEDYPDTHVSPLTFDGASDARRWNRGYVRDGRQPENASSSDKKMPGGHSTISASQFRRGPLTAGEERNAPETTKAIAGALLSDLHDHLALAFPELCPTGAVPGFEPLAKGEQFPVIGLNPPSDEHPKKETPPKPEGISHTDLPGGDWDPSAVQKPAPAGGAPCPPGGQGLQSPDLPSMKISEAELTKALDPVRAELTKALGVVQTALTDLSSRVEALESAPDPAQAPWRGAVAAALQKAFASQTDPQTEEALTTVEKGALQARLDQVEYLRRQTRHSNPQFRLAAEAELKKLLGA